LISAVPEYSERLPPAVVVEDVLVGLVELADDVKDSLRYLWDKGSEDGAVAKVEHV
jgi:hypothetical protein